MATRKKCFGSRNFCGISLKQKVALLTKLNSYALRSLGQHYGIGYASFHDGEASPMTVVDMRCAVDHFVRNGFLKLQYRLRRLGFPRDAVIRGLFVSEQLLKGLRILR